MGWMGKIKTLSKAQPFTSVTCRLLLPGQSWLKLAPVPAPLFHEYVYPGTPPTANTEEDPLQTPAQVGGCVPAKITLNSAGSVTCTVVAQLTPCPWSVTMTIWLPGQTLFHVAVAGPPTQL